jgi:hypothetical protein
MPSLPSISVVVPCDAAHIPLVPGLLEHITKWDLGPAEVVVAASRVRRSEQTKILSDLSKLSWPFRLVCLPTRRRHMEGPNRNRGALAVTATHIIFLDADDFLAPWASEFIARTFLELHPDVVMYSYTEQAHRLDGRPIWSVDSVVSAEDIHMWYAQDVEQAFHNEPDPIRVSEDGSKRVHHGSLAVKRDLLNDVQYGRRRLAADLHFCKQIMERGYRVVFLDEPLLEWTHSHSTTSGLRVELSRNRARAVRFIHRLASGGGFWRT